MNNTRPIPDSAESHVAKADLHDRFTSASGSMRDFIICRSQRADRELLSNATKRIFISTGMAWNVFNSRPIYQLKDGDYYHQLYV